MSKKLMDHQPQVQDGELMTLEILGFVGRDKGIQRAGGRIGRHAVGDDDVFEAMRLPNVIVIWEVNAVKEDGRAVC